MYSNATLHRMVWEDAGEREVLVADAPASEGATNRVREFSGPGSFSGNLARAMAGEGVRATLATILGIDPATDAVEVCLRNHWATLGAARNGRARGGAATSVRALFLGDDIGGGLLSGDGPAESAEWETDEAPKAPGCPPATPARKALEWLALGDLPADRDGSASKRVIRTARRAGIPVSWTPGPAQLRLGASAFADVLGMLRLIVLNRQEAIEFCGLDTVVSAATAAVALAGRAGKGVTVVVTDAAIEVGSAAVCYEAGQPYAWLVPPIPVPIADPAATVGAFHGGLVAGLLKGMSQAAALGLARRKAAACARSDEVCRWPDWNGDADAAGAPEPIIQFDPHPWYT